MSTPYEKHVVLVTDGVNQIKEVDFPGRIALRRINITHGAGTAFSFTIYNRAFTADAVSFDFVGDNGSGNARLHCVTDHELKVGDTITVAGSAAAYNGSQTVTAVIDRRTVDTSKSYTANGAGGTLTLAIPAAQQPQHEVIPATAAAGGTARFVGDVAFHNQDAETLIGVRRKLYILFTVAGTYYVGITGADNLNYD